MVIEQREACEKAQDVFWNRPIIEGDPPHGPRHPCGSLRRCSPISHSHNHVVFASTIVLGRHCCCLSTHNPRRSRSEPSSSPTSAVIMAEEDDWETVSPLITCLPIPKPRHAAQLYRTTPTKLIHSPGGPLECRPLQTQIIEARTIPLLVRELQDRPRPRPTRRGYTTRRRGRVRAINIPSPGRARS
jgi:hypothetical protein